MSCIIWGCNNNNDATADPAVHYYVFPKHPMVAQQWINVCGWPPEEIDLNTARICSIHFSEDSYTTEVKVMEYIACYTKVLKYDAVPTLFLPLTTHIVVKAADAQEQLREMIVFAPSTQQALAPKPDNKKEYTTLLVNEQRPLDQDMEKYQHVQSKEQLSTLEDCNKSLREKITNLEQNDKSLRQAATKLMESYKMKDLELSNLHQEYLRAKRSFISLQNQKELLSKVFSESQIKILSGKKKIYWSNDDMAVGYTIRHLSNRRCYMYLTKKLNIPLPAVSSIKRWMTLKNTDEKKSLTDVGSKKMGVEDDDSD